MNVLHEADEPDFIAALHNNDVLTSKYGTEVNFLPVKADLSTPCHGDRPVMELIPRYTHPLVQSVSTGVVK